MNKAIFLDRDGVINKEKNWIHKKEDLELIKNSAEAIAMLNENGFKVIIITNQPVVARGLCTEEEVQEINDYLKNLLKDKGATVDAVYYCPHHPSAGDNPKYTRECECRKPKPGMILQAQKDLFIDKLEGCFIVGDKMGDLKAGNSVGCKTILVKTGYGGEDGWEDAVPDYIAEDLYDAVKNIILKK